jgi:hypothetical protein
LGWFRTWKWLEVGDPKKLRERLEMNRRSAFFSDLRRREKTLGLQCSTPHTAKDATKLWRRFGSAGIAIPVYTSK